MTPWGKQGAEATSIQVFLLIRFFISWGESRDSSHELCMSFAFYASLQSCCQHVHWWMARGEGKVKAPPPKGESPQESFWLCHVCQTCLHNFTPYLCIWIICFLMIISILVQCIYGIVEINVFVDKKRAIIVTFENKNERRVISGGLLHFSFLLKRKELPKYGFPP